MRWSVVLALLAVLCLAVPAVRAVSDDVEVADADGADTSEEFELAEVELAADAEDSDEADAEDELDIEEAAEEEAESDEEESDDSEDESEAEDELEGESEMEIATVTRGGPKPGAVFLIRHGEKPYPDDKELSARGKKRADALVGHFATLAKAKGVTIKAVYAQRSALDEPGRKGPTSKRPVDTVVPLAKALKTTVQKFWWDDYKKMVSQILDKGETAVICWEHDALTDVAAAFGVTLKWPEGRYDVTYDITWNTAQKASIAYSFQNLLVGDVGTLGSVPASVFVLPCDHEQKPSVDTKADMKQWKTFLGGEYALRFGGVRTVVAQKGCQSEIADIAKFLDAKMVDKLEKPKDVLDAVKKAQRENGIVLVVGQRNDIGKITDNLSGTATPYPFNGAGTTYHYVFHGAGKPTLTKVVNNKAQ